MASAPTTPLADGFPPASREAWLALVQRSLKGAAFETLVSRTADGLEIQPLYAPGDVQGRLTCRGDGEPAGRWDVRTVVSHPEPVGANAQILEDLEGGATSSLLKIGHHGCAITSEDDMALALSGVVLEAAAVALDSGFSGPQAARWLAACAKNSPNAKIGLHLDPLTAFAQSGASPGPISAHMQAAATTAAPLADTYPAASFFLATGRAAHEAGGSEAQELGIMAAAAVAYSRALAEQGMAAADAMGRIVFGLSVGGDYFTSIAKLRAGRRIAERLGEAVGARRPPVLEARASERMLTRLDPWTNLLRLTAAGFAGGAGGADAVVIAPFTDAIGTPSPLARRQARNTQLVLIEESHLGRVADPGAGSWFIESVTAELAREGWAVFQAIEREGGLAAALTSGFVAANVDGARAALCAAAEQRGILGVTRFPDPEERPVATGPTAMPRAHAGPDPRLPGEDSTCRPLPAMRIAEPYEVFDGALS
jgi:methylmalonyl-CoA mutase